MSNIEEEVVKSMKSKDMGDLKGIGIIGKLIGVTVLAWLASVSTYAIAFFALAMLPSVVAIVIDRGAGRFASKAVTACNFTGVLPFLFDIGITYDKSTAAQQLMSEPFTWVVTYGFSAIGWMLIWVLPQFTTVLFMLRADLRSKKLQREQKDLVEEWGDKVSEN